jgi:NAD(P)-dependent dehydrogenase (short-subunit alcohol dehydrogenase family)
MLSMGGFCWSAQPNSTLHSIAPKAIPAECSILRALIDLEGFFMDIHEVRAVITGGASGLGFACAQAIVAGGGKVVLLDVQDEKGAASAATLACPYLKTDVSNEAGVSANLAQAQQLMGGLNAAISCAGILGAGRVLGKNGPMPLSQFETTVRVNLIGSFNIAKAAANLMQNNSAGVDGERGVIINTASVAAYEGQIGQAAYSASKGGVVGMTLPMARELGRFGIRVMTIAPGIFWTPMVDGMPPEVRASLNASVPFPQRLGQPEEFAETVKFILSNRYLNGGTIRLDGAVRLAAK